MSMTLAAVCSASWLLVMSVGEVTLEEIHSKWRERTERSRSIRLTWDENRGSAKATGIQFTLGAQPSQIRLDNEMSGGPAFPAVRYVSTCNDVDCRGYFPGPRGSGGGHVWPKNDLSLFQLPIVQALRPFEAKLNEPTLDKYVLTKFRVKVKGDECIVLEEPFGARSFTLQSQVWVDPERDYVPRKFVEMVQGKESGAWYVCDYEKHATGVYLPSQWEAHFSDEEHITARVTKIETDLGLPDREFTIDFPPDTVVADKIAGEEYYIDRSGKKTMRVAQATRTPAQAAINRPMPWGGAVLAVVVTFGVIVVFLFRRRFSDE